MKTADRNIIDMEMQQTNAKPIETQTIASEQSSIQEEVTHLKSVISKTIENNNENVKEVEQELEKIANERKAATDKVISTDSFDTHNDFEPIVETFSEDDAIVIKPKTNGDERPAENVQENDYVIEDNTIKNGKLATVNVDNDRYKAASTIPNKHNEPLFTSNEFEESKMHNKGFDDVTISLNTAKVRLAFLIQAPFIQGCFALRQQQFPYHLFSFRSAFLYISAHTHTHTHSYLPCVFLSLCLYCHTKHLLRNFLF